MIHKDHIVQALEALTATGFLALTVSSAAAHPRASVELRDNLDPVSALYGPIATQPNVTFVYATVQDPITLDPHLAFDASSKGIVQNIYENLITFDGPDPNSYRPVLAEAIPQPEIMSDGSLQYTWKIIEGVTFHSGDELTAEDVAFSFWRSMLSNDPDPPGNLLVEAFFGVNDIAELAEPRTFSSGNAALSNSARSEKLRLICQRIKEAVAFDNAARTVTMKLVRRWSPFLATLASGPWAAIVEKDWQIENGDWDGDCSTWQDYYRTPSKLSLFRDKTNGTGPYMLEDWMPEEEVLLVANPEYRNDERYYLRIRIINVHTFGTRYAMLQAGDAHSIELDSPSQLAEMESLVRDVCDIDTGECTTINPDGLLRKFPGLPGVSRTDAYFNFFVDEASPFLGSGKLDGEGIPPDFFNDVHIRRAFNYCFDWDAYISSVFMTDAVKSKAITLPGMPGNASASEYTLDLARCEEEFRASTWTANDGTPLWNVGFYMQIPFTVGDDTQRSAANILSTNLQQINSGFFISPVALPPALFQRALRANHLPVATVHWQERIHDPHNWYVPYLLEDFASRFNLPERLQAKYRTLIDEGVVEANSAKRAELYSELNKVVFSDAPLVVLAIANSERYEPLYLEGWYGGRNQNPLVPPFWYHDFSLSRAASPPPYTGFVPHPPSKTGSAADEDWILQLMRTVQQIVGQLFPQ